ncbi:hypothetical protein DFH09DRAFT_1209853 [Mycena vulgaris]|nr:hypothetical protein DFH09DRAFT_1209853 [Mycena vulgaris]
MFQLRFLRWIRGLGYPRSLRGAFVTAKEYKAHRRNPLIRAERFLYSMSGFPFIPHDPNFALINLMPKQRIEAGESGAPSLRFHNCTSTLDVPFTDWIENVLLQEVDFDDRDMVTDFDHWMSAEVALEATDYNTY